MSIDHINHQLDDYAREAVPESALRPSWTIIFIWLAGLICLPALLAGVMLGQIIDLRSGLVALFLSHAVLSVFIGLSGYVGAKTRLTSAMNLKKVFGVSGGIIPAALLGLVGLGWFAVQLELFAQSLLQIMIDNGVDISLWALIIGGGILMSSTAVIGFRAIDWLSRIAGPFMLIVILYACYNILAQNNWAFNWDAPSGAVTTGAAVSFLMGSISMAMIIAPDVTRYAREARRAGLYLFLSVLILNPSFLGLGLILSNVAGSSNLIEIMLISGAGLAALTVIILGTWTTNDTNLYVSSLALTNALPKIRKWQVAILAAIVGSALAGLGIVGNYVVMLNLISVTFAPAAIVFILDYFMGDYAVKNMPKIRLYNLTCWILGGAAGYMTLPQDQMGMGLFSLTGASAIDGLVVAAALYASRVVLLKIKMGQNG